MQDDQNIAGIDVKENNFILIEVFERITDAFMAVDENFCYIYVNKKAGELSNREPSTLLGKNVWEEFPSSVGKPVYKALHQAMKQQKYIHLEDYYPENDCWIEHHIYPSTRGISIFFRDITEKKKMEVHLKQSEERYRLLFEQSHDGIFIADFEGKILEGNSEACKMSGYTKEELLTKTLQDLTPEHLRGAYPEFFSLMRQRTSILAEGQLLKKDDSISMVEISSQMTSDGNIALFSRDITSRKAAEMELKEAEEKFRNLVEKSLVGVYIIQDGRFVYVNPKLCEIYGFTQNELIGADITITGKDDEEMKKVNENIRARIEGKTDSVQYEMSVRRKDKTPINVEVYGSRTMYKGQPAIIGTLINITERKKAELQLREAEQKFRDLAEKSLVCIYIIQDEKFVYVNPKFAEEYGFTMGELIGMDIYEVIIADENERNKVRQNIQLRLAGKVDSMHYEMKGLRKDNTVFDVEVFGSRTIFQGRPAIIGTLINITERKEAERALLLSQQKYKLMFESNPVPMWMFSKTDFSIIDVNNAACKLYGYSREEFLKMSIRDMRPEEDIPLFMEKIGVFQTININQGIWRHRKKDGSIIHVEIIGNDIIYQGREVRLALANNITEKLAAEESLKKSYEEIRQLTKHLQNIREEERTSIAREIHDELGQQLTVLKMDVAWLDRKLAHTSNAVTEKLDGLMDMLDGTIKTVRRISTELRPSILDDLGLNAAIEWHLKEFEKRSGIKTQFSKPAKELLLNDTVKTGLFRIFQESLTNVARHSAAKNLRINLSQKDDHILLRIKDDGIGFNKEQVGQKRTLGILGMKERTEMMGGHYEITSAEGKGTVVIVNVPCRQP
jgi:PAS domain S-box-containing protein